MPQKHTYPIDERGTSLSATDRQARAADFIAHYLDRIESHLERIANALENGGVNENLRLQLASLEAAIRKTSEA